MAVAVHIVHVALKPVNSLGGVIHKESASIGEIGSSSTEPRVIPDSDIASSANWPSVDSYITAEAAIDFVVHYMDQNTIITYDQGAVNSAS